jgi:hypothetical protein
VRAPYFFTARSITGAAAARSAAFIAGTISTLACNARNQGSASADSAVVEKVRCFGFQFIQNRVDGSHDANLAHTAAALDRNGVRDPEKAEFLAIFERFRGEIVEGT